MSAKPPLRALSAVAKGSVRLVELPPDEAPLAADELTGPTLASLSSPGTEVNSAVLGESFPATFGYAAIFRVEQTGHAVEGLRPGDLVFCTGPNGIGGHRSHQRCPRSAAIALPDGLNPLHAPHARLAGVCMSTLRTTACTPPGRVLITGLGPVGHLAAQIFHACGYRVAAVEPNPRRRQWAMQAGIPSVCASTDELPPPCQGRFELAVECSGHEQATLDAARQLAKTGELSILGVPWKQRADLSAHELLKTIYRRYLTVRSGWEWQIARHPTDFRRGSVFDNLAAALDWLATGRINVANLTAVHRPEDAPAVYEAIIAGQQTDALFDVFDWS